MKQRKFEIVISENKNAGSSVTMKIGNDKEGYKCLDYKFDSQELTEEEICFALSKLMSYFLAEVPVEVVEEDKTVAKLIRTPDGKFVHANP